MSESQPHGPDLDRLARLVPPPAAPVGASGDWEAVERELGVSLPADYRALVTTYGYGMFDDFLEVLTPFSRPGERLMDFGLGTMLQTMRDNRAAGVPIPYPLWPEPGGLLPWGMTSNADWCYWITTPSGQPDRWRIFVDAHGDWWEHPGPLTAALVDILSGAARIRAFPDDFPSSAPWFTSIPPADPDGT